MNAAELLVRARTHLLYDYPLFGCLVMGLELVKSRKIPTAMTNGKKIKYNPEFVESLSLPELLFVLGHEVLHCALGHTWRGRGRDKKRWNKACDYTINGDLVKAGFTMPESALFDPQYVGLSAEEVYDRLPPESEEQSAEGDDPGQTGGVEAVPAEARKELEARWQNAVKDAMKSTKEFGQLPGSLREQLERVVQPKMPWWVLLRDFVERTARNDYNWSRPNPRYLQRGFILPSLISEELPEIVIASDTSGSTREAWAQFEAEASGVLQAYRTTIHLLFCDAQIQAEHTLTSDDLPLHLESPGGGGTDFRPVFEHITRQGWEPACLIYLTDLYGSFPAQAPSYPVLWVRIGAGRAPWGEVIDLR